MEIAIISSDTKKLLVTEFCMAYCGILSRHHLCATATTGKYITDATGLVIEKLLTGSRGGIDQIASRITYNEIDLLLYFGDPTHEMSYLENEMNIIRLCDMNNVPVATNIASAEALIFALERGDLDWRENIRKEGRRI
ncbi:MAG: methylglyoxal synthase [Clostridia bacterium]|jgi:methylglyoxal synthase|nr:methylglyoxal synthase [Clostridia bacterium]MBO7400054.1 methylglyoxal synthase [Clostridia bacterium]MBO7549004.1 methylglyoxal synthase [Clostridia bacterium]MBO7666022.1 methylglyoxal synthase [Clostridia bacterium]MBP5238925.1 methylglyoxal synthase [Clostridia bacterium]